MFPRPTKPICSSVVNHILLQIAVEVHAQVAHILRTGMHVSHPQQKQRHRLRHVSADDNCTLRAVMELDELY